MDLSMFALTGKVAIVTGAGRGIGKTIALGLADAGADVVACARSIDDIEDTASKIRDKGSQALAIPTDVKDVDQVTIMLNKTLDSFGKVDILVNNAGGGTGPSDFLQMTLEQWEKDISQNLTSVFVCTNVIGKQMVQQKSGNVINMSSVVATGPFGTFANYSAAKAGIINFTQTLAVQWAKHNIRVNAIAPGYIETARLAKRYEENPELRQRVVERIPMGRLGKPEEIIGAAIYLASDASSYVTGATIVVSGAISSLAR